MGPNDRERGELRRPPAFTPAWPSNIQMITKQQKDVRELEDNLAKLKAKYYKTLDESCLVDEEKLNIKLAGVKLGYDNAFLEMKDIIGDLKLELYNRASWHNDHGDGKILVIGEVLKIIADYMEKYGTEQKKDSTKK